MVHNTYFLANMPIRMVQVNYNRRNNNAKIDAYISTARRHGETWLIGSVYNEPEGALPLTLDFLTTGKEYDITYYEDTGETNFYTNPQAYRVRKGTVRKGDVINAKIAPGGGHCMWVRPKID